MDNTLKSRIPPSKDIPKLTMHEKLENEEILQRINRKIDFKKNPRYEGTQLSRLAEVTLKPIQTINNLTQTVGIAASKPVYFRSQPHQIVFFDYEVGKVYEFQVNLINASQFMRRIRLAPIRSPQFTIAQVKYPSKQTGDIAPGMALRIKLWFKPAELKDYQDELVVLSQDSPFKIPITARREPTKVNLLQTLDCGNCWIGDQVSSSHQLVNTGGLTHFDMVVQEPTAGVATSGEILLFDNFTIQPRSFKLAKGEKVSIKYGYCPKDEGQMTKKLKLVCDNGTVIPFNLTGCGYTAQLALIAVNNEKSNEHAKNHRVYFENAQPGVEQTSRIIIRNLATVDLKYKWNMSQSSLLKIGSLTGKFKPKEQKTIEIKYTCFDHIPHYETISIELLDIPSASIKSKQSSNNSLEYYCFEIVSCPQKLTMAVQPPLYVFPQQLYVGALYHRKFILTNPNNVDLKYEVQQLNTSTDCQSSCEGKGTIKKQEKVELDVSFRIHKMNDRRLKASYVILVENVAPLYFEVEGFSKCPEIMTDKECVDFGLMRTKSQNRQTLTISNPCPIPVTVQLTNHNLYYVDQMDDMYIYDEETIVSKPRKLEIQAPETLTIPAHGSFNIPFLYHSKAKQTFRDSVDIQVVGGHKHTIEVFAEVQEVEVVINKNSFNLQEIFVGNVYDLVKSSKSRRPLELYNLGNIDTQFEWENIDNDRFKVEVEPAFGKLPAKQSIKINMNITPIRTTNLNEIFRCFIQGMASPLQLSVSAQMKGLEVGYYLMDESQAKRVKVRETMEDFVKTKSKKYTTMTHASGFASTSIVSGQKEKVIYPNLEKVEFFNCIINTPKQIDIILANLSDLDTDFELHAEQFKTLERQKETKGSKGNLLGPNDLAFTSQMGKTLMANRQLEISQKQHLSNNKGVSILCEPSNGTLAKGSEVPIKITLFNDICGRFTDKLAIRVNKQIRYFPIDVDIKGTPVCISRNQIGINFNKEIPLFKLGVYPVKSGIIRREFRVVNNGPKPVEVNWKIFSSSMQSDEDLFKIQFQQPDPGSANIVKVNWDPIEPKQEENSSFSIEPRIKTLQGREESSFVITFRSADQPRISRSTLIGQPYLLVSEGEKTKMELLTLTVQAESIKPKLSMNPHFEKVLTKFERHAGKDTPLHTKTIMLENTTEANLIFSLELTNKAFEIIHTYTNCTTNNQNVDPKLMQSSKGLMKKTLHQAVQTSFTLVPRSHLEVRIRLNGDSKAEDWPNLPKVRREGKLEVSYSNGESQEFELLGELLRPELFLNTTGFQGQQQEDNVVDFGVVHVKNHKNHLIYLSNSSRVSANWALKYVKWTKNKTFQPILWTKQDKQHGETVDDKDCFQFSVTEGVCESLSTPIHLMPSTLALPAPDDQYAKTHVPQKIIINFKPKKNVLYKSKYKIIVEDGQPIELIIRGTGSYAEEKEH